MNQIRISRGPTAATRSKVAEGRSQKGLLVCIKCQGLNVEDLERWGLLQDGRDSQLTALWRWDLLKGAAEDHGDHPLRAGHHARCRNRDQEAMLDAV